MACLNGKTNAHRDQDIRRVLARVKDFAETTGVAVVIVRHLNKAAGGSAIYRGGGSIGITAAARSGLLVARDPENENHRVLASTKCNLRKEPESLNFHLEGTDTDAARVVWGGVSTHTANALLAIPASGEEQSERQEAKDFLRELLAQGPVPANEVHATARQAGISEMTLRRAKNEIGVVAKKDGFQGQWLWGLPSNVNAGLNLTHFCRFETDPPS